MTIKELHKLKPGTLVRWSLEPSPPGRVCGDKTKRWIEWEDGQRTEDYDDWALIHVNAEDES